MAGVFTAAVLLAAFLLFFVQPMAAKMLLPSLGGSPSVWNVCVVFYQGLLLAAYSYAHLLTTRLPTRAQATVHAAVVLLPFALLPIHVATAAPPAGAAPTVWLLRALLLSVGLPFFVIATTGPLLQRWFSKSSHPFAADPYFLYAASNAGSLGALLAYPLVVERSLPLAHGAFSQSAVWSGGYGVFALLVGACTVAAWRSSSAIGRAPAPVERAVAAPSPGTRFRWLALSFVPSSAMLGATQYLTTDIAAVPLLWVLPLGIYLLTFIVAFSKPLNIPTSWSWPAYAVLATGVGASLWVFLQPSPRLAIPLHVFTLLALGLCCHSRLAEARPAPAVLTEYFLWIAAGGALGGVFHSLLAPLLFTSPVEYPIALFLAAIVHPWWSAPATTPRERRSRVLDLALPAALATFLVLFPPDADRIGLSGSGARWPWQVLAASLACALMAVRPLRFALALAVLLTGGWLSTLAFGEVLHAERTFFGVYRVLKLDSVAFTPREGPQAGEKIMIPSHTLFHGTTRHGSQILHPVLRVRAGSYYHITGPIGSVFRTLRHSPLLDQVGIVGLGAGTLAVYGEPGQQYTFFEIDPAVERIARDPELFTYLRDAVAEVRVITGDARLSLAAVPDGTYGLIVVDAFSSDSIPAHLLTREAVRGYFDKLQPGGILAVHLSSQYFELLPVVAAIASDQHLSGSFWTDVLRTPEQAVEGKSASQWAVLARTAEAIAPLRANGPWRDLSDLERPEDRRRLLWTDDSSSPLNALKPR